MHSELSQNSPARRSTYHRFMQLPSVVWVVLVWAIVACQVVVQHWAQIVRGAYVDPDSMTRLVQVHDLLAGQGWYDLHQYRMGAEGGTLMHWARLGDIGPSGLLLLLRPLLGGVASDRAMMVIYPLLLMLGAITVSAAVARRLAGRASLLPVLILWATTLNVHALFAPDNIDHHSMQIILMLLLFWAVIGEQGQTSTRRDGVIAGLAVAGAMIIGMETIVYILAVLIAVALRWLLDPEREAPFVTALGFTIVFGLGLAAFAFMPRPWVWDRCDSFTPATLILMSSVGVSFIVTGGFGTKLGLVSRLGLSFFCLLGIILLVISPFAVCLAPPYPQNPILVHYWLGRVIEMEPVARMFWQKPAEVPLYLTMAPAVLVLAVWRVCQGPNWRAWLSLGLPVLAALLLTLWQVRAQFFLNSLALPLAAALIADWREVPARRLWGWILFSTLPYFGLSIIITMLHDRHKHPSKKGAQTACEQGVTIGQLNRLPAGLVMAPINSGPFLLSATHHRALSASYHRNLAGNVAAFSAFTDPPTQALPIIRAYGVAYVVLCPRNGQTSMMATDAPQGLMAQLVHQRPPPWLQPVPGFPNDLRVFRVLSDTSTRPAPTTAGPADHH